ncbi:hypothetical protein CRG98_001939 [Punica granatum]|uniref:Uncharacterized protein n=1 Tax=Punica granatum TaxID=22663 RepID=A0A2I0LBT6_PUNGR|nr:hypothetical protein CRG98_001939 [Punica granatum]
MKNVAFMLPPMELKHPIHLLSLLSKILGADPIEVHYSDDKNGHRGHNKGKNKGGKGNRVGWRGQHLGFGLCQSGSGLSGRDSRVGSTNFGHLFSGPTSFRPQFSRPSPMFFASRSQFSLGA